MLHRLGDLADARAAHARAFELGAGSAAMFNNRGVTRLALGEISAAVEDFADALAIFQDPTILENRATAHCQAGKVDLSVADRLAAIELNGDGAEDLETLMRASGFEGGPALSPAPADPASALVRWTAAGCPGGPAARFW